MNTECPRHDELVITVARQGEQLLEMSSRMNEVHSDVKAIRLGLFGDPLAGSRGMLGEIVARHCAEDWWAKRILAAAAVVLTVSIGWAIPKMLDVHTQPIPKETPSTVHQPASLPRDIGDKWRGEDNQ